MGKDMMDGGVPGDWISPILGFLGDAMNGPGYTISFPPCRLTPPQVKKLLKKNGIKAWGVEILDGQGCITVRKDDAARACQLLQSHGVPVSNAPQQPAQPNRPRKARGGGGPFSVFDNVFGRR